MKLNQNPSITPNLNLNLIPSRSPKPRPRKWFDVKPNPSLAKLSLVDQMEEKSSAREDIPSERPVPTVITIPTASLVPNTSPKSREQSVNVPRAHPISTLPTAPTPLPAIQLAKESTSFLAKRRMPKSRRNEKVRRTTMSSGVQQGLHKLPSKCADDCVHCSVLIVDDNATNRCVLKALLRRCSYNSIEANDGSEAVNLVEKYLTTQTIHEIEVIFMDLQMPTMNGIQATAAIIASCQKARIPAPPIIGVSSDPSEEDREKFLNAGIQEFISKPIDKQKVGYVIDKYMKKGS